MINFTDDDAFSSSAAAGILAYTLPSAMDIFSTPSKQYDYFDFNDRPGGLPKPADNNIYRNDYIEFQIQVVGEDKESEEPELECGGYWRNCHLWYHQHFTPELIDIVPSQVVFGDDIAWMLNAKACHNQGNLPTGW